MSDITYVTEYCKYSSTYIERICILISTKTQTTQISSDSNFTLSFSTSSLFKILLLFVPTARL